MKMVRIALLAIWILGQGSLVAAERPDWQSNIDWGIGNFTSDPGTTNCPDQYTATVPKCLFGGGRACVM